MRVIYVITMTIDSTQIETITISVDFDTFFLDQYRGVFHDVYAILGNRTSAEDVTQEAFARAHLKWKTIENYDKPGAWVRRVALRIAISSWRKLSREASLDEVREELADEVSPIVLDLRLAITQLSRSQKAAVILHYYHDYLVNEVATTLGWSVSTAKTHLTRGRDRLREILTTKGYENGR